MAINIGNADSNNCNWHSVAVFELYSEYCVQKSNYTI